MQAAPTAQAVTLAPGKHAREMALVHKTAKKGNIGELGPSIGGKGIRIMTTSLREGLPDTLHKVQTRPLFVMRLDVRLVLKTFDGALIGMTYRGIRHGPPDIIGRLEKGETVDPDEYHSRVAPLFETAATQYAWLNNVVAVGIGHRPADGHVYYSIFEVQ